MHTSNELYGPIGRAGEFGAWSPSLMPAKRLSGGGKASQSAEGKIGHPDGDVT